MILADKIITLRKKNGWSQEELAEMMEVSRQSISKWEGAQAVPDLKKIIRMSEIFGVSTDLLVKDELELEEVTAPAIPVTETESTAQRVSMDEAVEYLAAKEWMSRVVPVGVVLCILCPIPLIALSALQEAGKLAMSEDAAAGIGLLFLILIVGCAVAVLVVANMRFSPYEFLEKEPIETEYGVTGMVRERKAVYRDRHMLLMVSGIVLCVLSAVPLFIAMAVFPENDLAMILSICVLLVVVAAGVFLIVKTSSVWGGYEALMEEGDYSREKKGQERRDEVIGSVYWPLVTALYLGYSFVTMAWHRSWIIWPVAAVLYGAVTAIWGQVKRRG